MAGGRGEKAVGLLGTVRAFARDGSAIELPSASQRRLLAILALHTPRRLRREWLADELGDLARRAAHRRCRGCARRSAPMCSQTAAPATRSWRTSTRRGSPGRRRGRRPPTIVSARWSRPCPLWTGPALEEFRGEAWADGEIARLTEIHAGTVDDLADELIAAQRSAEAVALLERQIARAPLPRPVTRAADPRAWRAAVGRPMPSARSSSTGRC